MKQNIHTNVKLFLPNPYVVRLHYTDLSLDKINLEYSSLKRKTYKAIKSTWGYCNPSTELVRVKHDHRHKFPPGHRHFEGMSTDEMIASLHDPDWQSRMRGYFAFSNEADALVFRLWVTVESIRVTMWPSNLFTIHEYSQD